MSLLTIFLFEHNHFLRFLEIHRFVPRGTSKEVPAKSNFSDCELPRVSGCFVSLPMDFVSQRSYRTL